MGYSKELYDKSIRTCEQYRMQAIFNSNRRLAEVYSKSSKIKAIDDEITQVGINTAKDIATNPTNKSKIAAASNQIITSLKAQRTQAMLSAGFPIDYTDVKYHCAKCEDTGYVENKRCECLTQLLIEESYKESNLYNLLNSQSFDDFKLDYYSDTRGENNIAPRETMSQVLNISKNFAYNFKNVKKGLFFYGGVGLGKTFLSSAVAKVLIESGYTVVYQSAAKLCSAYMDYVFGRIPSADGRENLQKLYDCDLLIIDDLGSEASNQQTASFIFELLNERLLSGKKMIISTNFNLSELAKEYSERFSSRIFEYFELLKFVGKDIRLIKLQGNMD